MADLRRLAEKVGVAFDLAEEYHGLFVEHGIPLGTGEAAGERRAQRLIMVSTHGYWGDPPPAGLPDTGGQVYYVLEVSKAWARQGRQVIILARWFEDYPRVERFADGVWLVRIRAGGDEFVRKEDIYDLTPQLAEAGTAVGALFGAEGVVGHYADGMAVAVEMGNRLEVPVVCVPHSIGVSKMLRLGWDPLDQAQLRDPEYHFWIRESFELAALKGANFEIANTPGEPEILAEHYGLRLPHEVMPAGAARPFFEAGEQPPDPAAAGRFGLIEKRYVLFWGRLSKAKFVEGVVQVLGEARRLRPDLAGDLKALIIGGSPDDPSEGEREVEENIRAEMQRYGLDRSDVIRLESQSHARLAPLARAGLAYVGTQRLEPFGMGAAEAMGAGLPVLVSSAAGITRWLEDGKHALFLHPDDPRGAAAKLVGLIEDPAAWELLSRNGRQKSLADFSWEGIAHKQGAVMDRLCAGKGPGEAGAEPSVAPEHFTRRSVLAFHRNTPAWRGDVPHIKPHHVSASFELVPRLVPRIRDAARRGERLVVAVGGESGSGKSEIAHLLTLMLRKEGSLGIVIPGDAFFVLPPAKNHANRVSADQRGHLEEAVGSHEVDLERLDRILGEARRRSSSLVQVPSDCRSIPGRRYRDVPVDLDGVDALFIDLTYGLLLDNVTCKVFLERTVLDQIDAVRERNLARDPEQDFGFIQRVLELEHEIIGPLVEQADIVVDEQYRVRNA
jgi:glycosyltransferase involved in cell wall biosynthesis